MFVADKGKYPTRYRWALPRWRYMDPSLNLDAGQWEVMPEPGKRKLQVASHLSRHCSLAAATMRRGSFQVLAMIQKWSRNNALFRSKAARKPSHSAASSPNMRGAAGRHSTPGRIRHRRFKTGGFFIRRYVKEATDCGPAFVVGEVVGRWKTGRDGHGPKAEDHGSAAGCHIETPLVPPSLHHYSLLRVTLGEDPELHISIFPSKIP